MSIATSNNAQFLDTAVNPPLLSGDFTFCMWIMVTSFTGGGTFMVSNDHPGSTIYFGFFYTSGGVPRVQSPAGGTNNTIGGGALTLNTWEFFAFTHNAAGSTTKFYRANANLNVTLENTISETYAGDPNHLWMFNDEGQANRSRGPIIGYKEWAAELSQQDIENEARQIMPRRTLNLKRFLPHLNNAEAGRDYSGNGNDLTKNGTFTELRSMPPIPYSTVPAHRLW